MDIVLLLCVLWIIEWALAILQSLYGGRSKTGHFDQLYAKNRLPRLIVNGDMRESLRAFSDESLITSPRHVEFSIDEQGYIRARWLPAENDAWRKIDVLLKQVELLRNETPRVPAPDDEHVH